MVVLDDPGTRPVRAAPAVSESAERAARTQLREQIGGLERQLSVALVGGFARAQLHQPGPDPAPVIGGRRAGSLLTLGELERVRDDLAGRVAAARGAVRRRGEQEAAKRELLERMLLDPGRHRFVRVTRADVGEPGCGAWHVRPRRGLIGMMMGWWHVKLSSGCPSAT